MMKFKSFKSSLSILVLTSMAVGLYGLAQAFEFRQFSPLGPPVLQGAPGAKFAEEMAFDLDLKPIPRQDVEKAVRDFFTAWNGGSVSSLLAPEFVDASRLLDAITDTVPRDAKIRIQSIGAVATLPGDIIEELPNEEGFDRVAIVSVTVDTVIEFTDDNGFQKIKGVNEYLFKVREEYR
jgi:hypothetical protein